MSSSPKSCIECGEPLAVGAAERCRACVFASALAPDLDEAEDSGGKDVAHLFEKLLLATRPSAEVKLHQFGDYELIEEVARGGMGVVFRAHQVSIARPVALKFILSHRLDSMEGRQRFSQEAEAAARLDHPNIVPVYEAGEYQGHPFLSMKFIEGGTLANGYGLHHSSSFSSFQKERKELGDVVAPSAEGYDNTPQLVAKIARAIHYAHGRGVLHRDLKPSNILIDQNFEPHVHDFGLAKFSDIDSDLTCSAAMLGTPRYMSPEQCRSDHASVSTASDVYALGVILYELLAGRVPFEGDSTLEVIRKINEEPPPSLNLTGTNRNLATICLKCLEKDPAQRYPSAMALADDLDRFDRGEPIAARPVGSLEGMWKWARRKPALAASLAVAILALLLGTVISLWQANTAREAERHLAANLYAADMASVHQALEARRLGRARTLLRKHIPAPGAQDHRGWEWRWFWQQSQPQYVQFLKGHLSPLRCLAIAPDELTIATGSEDGTIKLWDVVSGKHRVLRRSFERVSALSYSPDGTWLAASVFHWEESRSEKITLIYDLRHESSAHTHELRQIIPIFDNRENLSRWVREQLINTSLVFVRTTSDSLALVIGSSTEAGNPELRLWDFKSGEESSLVDLDWGADVTAVSASGQHLAIAEHMDQAPDQIRVYDTLTRTHLQFPSALEGKVTSLAFSPDDELLGITLDTEGRPSGSTSALVKASTGQLVVRGPRLEGQHSSITFVDENAFVTMHDNTSLHEWLIGRRGETFTIEPGQFFHGIGGGPEFRNTGLVRIAVAPEAGWLATATIDGHVRRWSLNQNRSPGLTRTERTRSYPITAKVSRDAMIIAASSGRKEAPQEVLVWDHEASQNVSALTGMPLWLSPAGDRLLTFTFSTNHNEHYAGTGFNGSLAELTEVVHWDVTVDPAKATLRAPIKPPLDGVTVRMPFPDGERAAVAMENGEIHIVDTRSGETHILPKASNEPVWGLGISPNERFLAFTGTKAGIYDLNKWRFVRPISFTRKVTNHRAFSPDSRFLAHAPSTNIVEIYDMENPEAPPEILYGHQSDVRNVAFSTDGKTLATGDHSGILKLWNVATRREMAEIASSWHVEFSADGRCLITDGHFERTDNRLTIRRAPTLEEIDSQIDRQ